MQFLVASFAILTVFGHVAKADTQPILYVSNFAAFVSKDPNFPSYISFHLRDPRPENRINSDCVYTTSKENPEAFPGWIQCRSNVGADLSWEEDSLKLRTWWVEDTETGPTGFVGVTKSQLTNWREAKPQAGRETCANKTVSIMGTLYSRVTEWEFPIATLNV